MASGGAHILVVEDEAITARDIRTRLERLGYEVPAIVHSGEEALALAERQRPDLVLMDIRLAGPMDGIETARQLRERFGVPVTYLTAYADESTIARAKQTMPYGFLLKPLEERELHSTIQMALYRHHLEEEVLEGRQWLATILSAIGDGVVATDADGLIRFLNPVAEDLTGWRQSEAMGQELSKVLKLQRRPPVNEAAQGAVPRRAPGDPSDEAVLLSRRGTTTPVDVTARTARDQKGNIVGFVWVFRDASRRKRIEDDLRESEAHFRTLIEHASDLILVMGTDSTVAYASPSVERVLGRHPDDLIGRPFAVFLAAEQRGDFLAALQNLGDASGLPLGELRVEHGDGSWRVLATLGSRVVIDGDSRVVVNAHDVTERKRAEDEKAELLAVTQDIYGTFNLEDLLERVEHRTLVALPCDVAATYGWDDSVECFRLLSQVGVEGELARELAQLQFARGDEPFGGRLGRGETVVIQDLAVAPPLLGALCARLGVACLLAVPLHSHGQEFGTYLAARSNARPFSPAEIRLAEGIARQLSIAIDAATRYRAQQSDAAVAAALARIGEEMVSSLDTPALLERLCQVTTEVLQVDCSHTWLWNEKDRCFVPVAGYGDPPEHWEQLRLLRLPRDERGGVLGALERGEVAEVRLTEFADIETVSLAYQFGIRGCLSIPLLRGNRLAGFHNACLRSEGRGFSAEQKRIARGIVQTASLALQNAQLFEQQSRANRLKSDFVATMSHELRGPVSGLMGFAELLLGGDFGLLTDEQIDAVRRIRSSAAEIRELIAGTLDVSRMEAGRLPMNLQEAHPEQLVASVREEMASRLLPPEVKLVWNVHPPLPLVVIDVVKFKVILKNLIGNALKFTRRGSVTVDVRVQRDGLELAVSDTGIGMSATQMEAIFEPFWQAHPEGGGARSGFGLGLYIVRRLVELLGGTIRVESTPGKGSTFRVQLPLRG